MSIEPAEEVYVDESTLQPLLREAGAYGGMLLCIGGPKHGELHHHNDNLNISGYTRTHVRIGRFSFVAWVFTARLIAGGPVNAASVSSALGKRLQSVRAKNAIDVVDT